MPSNAAAEHGPVDTLTARVVRSNISHLADQAAQVLASWVVSDSYFIFDFASNSYAVAWTSAAFPVRYRPDGSAYRLRIAINAAKVGSPNIRLDAFAIPAGRAADWRGYGARILDGDIPAEASATATITSTTPSWITLDRTWIQVQDTEPLWGHQSPGFRVDRPTIDAIGGRPATASYDAQRVIVMSRRTSSGTSALNLRGVYLAEFAGPS
jgi:hypothetical protein